MKVQPVRGWSPSTVRAILCRDLYRGVVVWNRSRKRDDWRQINQKARPMDEWIELPVNEALRIVSDDLWHRAQSRRADTAGKALRFADGRMSGRPPKTATKNLLAGLASWGECGGGLVVETSPRRRGRVKEYVCFRHRNHGTGVGKNQRHIRVEEMNEAVLAAIEEHALTPEAVEQVIQLTERDDARERRAALERERKDVDKRIARLVLAVETAGDVTSLAAKLRELEARRTAIDTDLMGCTPVPRLPRAVIENRLMEWRRLLRSSTTQGRAVLQRVLRGRIIFKPSGEGYRFEAPTRFDKLFSGMVALPKPSSQTVGTKGTWQDGGPFDADYGQRLEAAAQNHVKIGKRMASLTGFEPVFWP